MSTQSSGGKEDTPERPELPPGHLLGGRYRIVKSVASGGIGRVYRGLQLPLERPVAVKVLHDDLSMSDEHRLRFEREARILSALVHPNIVGLADYGIDSGRPYLVMELLEGRTLEKTAERSVIRPIRGIHIMRQILQGLAFAHDKGVVHRDLKPANVWLQRMPDGDEHVTLLDFGLARIFDATHLTDPRPHVDVTQAGLVYGTPAYMSPEQASGGKVDARSDVYSAGALFFELLTGRRPFPEESRSGLLRAHISEPVPSLTSVCPQLRVRPELAALIQVAMAKEPGERFGDARAMLVALDAIEAPAAWAGSAQNQGEVSTEVGVAPAASAPLWRVRPVAVLAALALVAVVGLTWSYGASAPGPPAASASPAPAIVPGPAVTGDPWAAPPPAPLRPFLAQVESGYVFRHRNELVPLYQLSREMQGDPRPLLLLGHLMVRRGWYTEGIRRFEMAYRRDPLARRDPRVLPTLLELAAHRSVSTRAAVSIERMYGTEALPAVERAAASAQGVAQLRLERVRDRLRADEMQ